MSNVSEIRTVGDLRDSRGMTMGTYYEVRCMDCDECGGVYADRQPAVAGAAVELAPFLAPLAGPFASTDATVVFGGSCIRADLEFFAKHAGHRMIAADGYGTDLGQCREWLRVPDSEQHRPCALPHNHEGVHNQHGPHERKRRG